jgi:hypothetical protein
MDKSNDVRDTMAVIELSGLPDVIERYRLEGPHATVIMLLTGPGQVGDDRTIRWHARRTELVHAGAGPDVIAHLDRAVESIDPRNEMVLLTANSQSAAHCWLADRDIAPMVHVGETPHLLAAVDELTDRTAAIGAIVDHLGADIYCVDHLDIAEVCTVKGDHVQTHRHTGGDQAGYQRRADAVYERNADTIARALTEQAVAAHARLIVMTGDDREAAAVEQHLDTHRFSVRIVQAGARHESSAVQRLHHAVVDESLDERQGHRNRSVTELRQALGQHALGVEGSAATVLAVDEGRVATLFVDRAEVSDLHEAIARTTLMYGGAVVVADELGVADGVAALVRY